MIAITMEGDVRLVRGLEDAIRKIRTAKPVLRNVGDVIVKEVVRNFPSEGARLEGRKWRALTPATIKQRIREGYGAGPILTRTGALKGGFRFDVTEELVRVWNPVEYFEYHQKGMGHNPVRRMIAFPEWLKQDVVAQFTRFINEAMRGL